ncbi:MAG: glycosyltransferase, partial [Thermosphaera sp.]
MRLAVIIPTYNEAENIPVLFERCFSSLAGLDFELVVVDDNSPDGTADVAERLGAA